MITATVSLASSTVILALIVGPLWTFSERVGSDLLQVRPYVEAVLEGTPPVPPLPVALESTGG